MTIKMYAPFMGQAIKHIGSNGETISVDANGHAEVSAEDFIQFLRIGFLPAVGQGSGMPLVRRTTATNNANCTLVANAVAFGKHVFLVVSGAAAITATIETANNIAEIIPSAKQWDTWRVRILNKNSGNLTLADGDNAAFNGTKVIAANKYADFMAQIIDMGEVVGRRIVFYNVGQGNAV